MSAEVKRVLTWTLQAQMLGSVVANGLRLGVSVVQTGATRYGAMAIVTPVDNHTVHEVFEQHAHKVLGENLTFRAAKRACEKYAEEWLSNKAPLEECVCEEIETP